MSTSNKGIIFQSLANKMLYCIKEYEAIKSKKLRLNRYEIVRILGSKQVKITASSVYNILKR